MYALLYISLSGIKFFFHTCESTRTKIMQYLLSIFRKANRKALRIEAFSTHYQFMSALAHYYALAHIEYQFMRIYTLARAYKTMCFKKTQPHSNDMNGTSVGAVGRRGMVWHTRSARAADEKDFLILACIISLANSAYNN